jgi:diacylglycerol kinase (ATP)
VSKPGGLTRIAGATRNSINGFAAALRHEAAFRADALLAVVLVPTALVLDVGGVAKAVMIASVLLVLVVELVNSAIEATVDRISLERHPLSGRAKDIGSAAVCLSLLNAAVVWLLVLLG